MNGACGRTSPARVPPRAGGGGRGKKRRGVARAMATDTPCVKDERAAGMRPPVPMGGAKAAGRNHKMDKMDRLTKADGTVRITPMQSHLHVRFEIHDKATRLRVAAHMRHMCGTFWRRDEGRWMGAPTYAWSVDSKHVGYLASIIRLLFEPEAVTLDPRLAAHARAFRGPAPFQK